MDRAEQTRMQVCRALAIVAVLELLFGRAFTRVGVFIPKEGLFASAFALVALASQALFPAAMLLVLVHTLLIVWLLANAGSGNRTSALVLRRGGAVLVAAVLLSSVLLAGASPAAWAVLAFGLLVALALLALAALAVPQRRWLAWLIAAAGALALTAASLSTVSQLAGIGSLSAAAPKAAALAEALLVAGALPLVLSVANRRVRPMAVALSVLAALLFCAVYLRSPAMTATLAIWTLGLTLYLPFPLYALALGLACYALLVSPDTEGVVLLLVAGLGFGASLYHLLLISALYTLAVSPALAAAEKRAALAAEPEMAHA